MKRFALLTGVAMVLGCSSASEVIAYNYSSDPIQLVVKDQKGETFSGTIDGGQKQQVWTRYQFSDPKFVFTVNGTVVEAPIPQRLIDGEEGITGQWAWDGQKATFTEVPLSAWQSMAFAYLSVGCICITLVPAVIVTLLRKRRRHSPLP